MIRYRQLSGRPDEAARARIRNDLLTEATRGTVDPPDAATAASAAVTAAITAPVQVNVYEGEASLDAVAQLLAGGKLTPRDLVNDGSGWTSIDEFLPLSDHVVRWHAAARRKRALPFVAGAMAVAAAIALWLFTRS